MSKILALNLSFAIAFFLILKTNFWSQWIKELVAKSEVLEGEDEVCKSSDHHMHYGTQCMSAHMHMQISIYILM